MSQDEIIAVATDAMLEHPTFAVIEPVRSFDNVSLTDWGLRRLGLGRKSSATGWGVSGGWSKWTTRTPCWKHGALAPRPRSRALPGRGSLPIQSPFSPHRVAAETGTRHGVMQVLARTEIARRRQLSWLSVVANHELSCQP